MPHHTSGNTSALVAVLVTEQIPGVLYKGLLGSTHETEQKCQLMEHMREKKTLFSTTYIL